MIPRWEGYVAESSYLSPVGIDLVPFVFPAYANLATNDAPSLLISATRACPVERNGGERRYSTLRDIAVTRSLAKESKRNHTSASNPPKGRVISAAFTL